MYSLKSKLSLSFVMVLLICILLLGAITNFILDNHFREYVRKNQEQKNKEIVTTLQGQFKHDNTWNMDVVETIGVSALENGLIIRVKDLSGMVIWDATTHNNGMCQRIIEQMAQNVSSRYPNVKGSYVEIPYPLYNNMIKMGEVEIGSYGPYYLSDQDLAFISTLNNLLLVVGAFSMICALVIGNAVAKRLSAPITKVVKTAQSISKGYFTDRITTQSDTNEINQLTSSINQLAETLETQEILRKRLTGDVAHELRTPIATLQSHMEAMIDGIWEPDAQRLQSCHDEIVRIGKLVGDLEKLAKYESENLVLNKERFDLSELVKRLMQNFERDFMNKGIEFTFSGSHESISGDKDKISQVIVNLLSNALKYTPEGGRVSVGVKGAEDITEMIVKDNGPGIPEEDIPFVFERFYRADKSRNRMTGGSGIGLTIAKAIVQAHKGKIDVVSGVGLGAEFIVSLPKG